MLGERVSRSRPAAPAAGAQDRARAFRSPPIAAPEVGVPEVSANAGFIYGPTGLTVEQINNSTGAVTYLHHDQQGSTRLITGSTGTAEGTVTYGPNGTILGSTGSATTPLGYDAQYTSTDTGLIYLRNRVYDPTTAQFLSSDPLFTLTMARYSYANSDPEDYFDPTGLCSINPIAPDNCFSQAPEAIGGAIVSVAETAAEHPAGAGAGAVGLDAKACLGGRGVACVAAGAGVAAAGGAAVVAGGLSGVAASGVNALGLTSGAIGFLSDLADALVPSGATAAGC
jgi:RHS repeat-associated protein